MLNDFFPSLYEIWAEHEYYVVKLENRDDWSDRTSSKLASN